MHNCLCIVFLFMKLKEDFVSRPHAPGTQLSSGMGIWCRKQERQDTVIVKYWNRILLMEQNELLNCCYERQEGNWKCGRWGKKPK